MSAQANQSRSQTAGLANSSSWNSSGFAFAPNTNTLDAQSMPSAQAQAARDKTAQVMAALKAGDTETANALMGKDSSKGKLLPGMGWVKNKLNKRDPAVLKGRDVSGAESSSTAVADADVGDSVVDDDDGGKEGLGSKTHKDVVA